jgi:hypothetical protein
MKKAQEEAERGHGSAGTRGPVKNSMSRSSGETVTYVNEGIEDG